MDSVAEPEPNSMECFLGRFDSGKTTTEVQAHFQRRFGLPLAAWEERSKSLGFRSRTSRTIRLCSGKLTRSHARITGKLCRLIDRGCPEG